MARNMHTVLGTMYTTTVHCTRYNIHNHCTLYYTTLYTNLLTIYSDTLYNMPQGSDLQKKLTNALGRQNLFVNLRIKEN